MSKIVGIHLGNSFSSIAHSFRIEALRFKTDSLVNAGVFE